LQNTENLLKSKITSSKRETLSEEIYCGVNNYILFQNNPGFRWPRWIWDSLSPSSPHYGVAGSPILTNNVLREWQTFNNFLSESSIRIDRSGLICASGAQNWSIEFWILDSDNSVIQIPTDELSTAIDSSSGELVFCFDTPELKYTVSMCGAKSSVDEVVLNFSAVRVNGRKKYRLILAVRPYCNLRLGGINSIEYSSSENLVAVNGVKQLAICKKPAMVYSGSSSGGDLSFSETSDTASVSCSSGLATMGFAYDLSEKTGDLTFRLSLDPALAISGGTVNYSKCQKEFADFAAHRIEEGINFVFHKKDFLEFFNRSRMRLLSVAGEYLNEESITGYRNFYLLSYAFNRAGFFRKSEKLLGERLKKISVSKKKPSFDEAMKSAFLILAYSDLYIHKRDSSFLQENFRKIREIGEAAYLYSVNQHMMSDFPATFMPNSYVADVTGYECIILQAAMDKLSGLARWMGIFGDEKKYSSESMRLQSIARDFLADRFEKGSGFSGFYSLLSFPEKALPNLDNELYEKFLHKFYEESFPVKNSLMGIDIYASLVLLNQLLLSRSENTLPFIKKFFSLFDEFIVTPEYVHPLYGRGCNGDGNSPVIAALLFVLLRNFLFFEYEDKIEILPFPEPDWFKQGSSLKVENGSTRFGTLNFEIETQEKEIRLILGDSPKYIPSEIKINFPFDIGIIDSDEFIVKKKIGNTYYLNGWPSVIKFPLKGR